VAATLTSGPFVWSHAAFVADQGSAAIGLRPPGGSPSGGRATKAKEGLRAFLERRQALLGGPSYVVKTLVRLRRASSDAAASAPSPNPPAAPKAASSQSNPPVTSAATPAGAASGT
jgi:hypothetical protein